MNSRGLFKQFFKTKIKGYKCFFPLQAVGFTTPWVNDRYRIFIAPYGQRINYSELLHAFNMLVWISIIILFFVMTFAAFAAFQTSPETIFSSVEGDIKSAVSLAYLTLLMRCHSRLPIHSVTGKVFTITFFFVGLFILSLYKAALLSKLAVKREDLPVASLEDVFEKGFTLGIYAGTNQEAFFRAAQVGTIEHKIWNKGQCNPDWHLYHIHSFVKKMFFSGKIHLFTDETESFEHLVESLD